MQKIRVICICLGPGILNLIVRSSRSVSEEGEYETCHIKNKNVWWKYSVTFIRYKECVFSF
jgi:hypothetical protein